MQNIGYLGPEGTHTQQAAVKYSTYSPGKLTAYPVLSALIQAVQKDQLTAAVIPLENSLEGSVNVTLDTLAWDVNLLIMAEIILPISHSLLVNQGSTYADLTTIFTHPQAAGQCRKYLENKLPHVQVVHSLSTAEGAKQARENGSGYGAIAPLQAAELYGLHPLDQGIEDLQNNFTRFAVVGKQLAEPSGIDKTSLVFSTEHQPGSLYRVLDILNLWDLNMTKIESRPARTKLGTYIFFVDLDGHLANQDVKDALTMIQRKTTFFKFLGSYPQAK